MSRQELAETANAHLWNTHQHRENMTEHDIGRYERGGHVREIAVRFLDADVAPLLVGKFGEQVGRSLMSATAELTQLAGWAAYDAGLHGLGQRYFIQSLRLALAAADRPLCAEIMAAMSHQVRVSRRASGGS